MNFFGGPAGRNVLGAVPVECFHLNYKTSLDLCFVVLRGKQFQFLWV